MWIECEIHCLLLFIYAEYGELDRFETQDALFDLAWSEIHENQVVTAGGDGSVRLWDITLSVRF